MKDIIQLSTGSANVLLVSLPEKVYWPTRDGNELCWLINTPYDDNVRDSIILPPGNWIEVGWSDSLTEDQAKELVEGRCHPFDEGTIYDHDLWFLDYLDNTLKQITALESWQSLLSANNINERKFVLRDNK